MRHSEQAFVVITITINFARMKPVKKLNLALAIVGILFLPVAIVSAQETQCPLRPTQERKMENKNVIIKNSAYNPSTIQVTRGTTVTWVNEDSVAHTATSNMFDSKNIGPGGRFSYTFDRTGTFDYHCTIHPEMRGRVIVN
jgi:plastocyanin